MNETFVGDGVSTLFKFKYDGTKLPNVTVQLHTVSSLGVHDLQWAIAGLRHDPGFVILSFGYPPPLGAKYSVTID